MKLTKTKKILLLGTITGTLATTIVVPVVLLGGDENNQEKQNQKDVESVVKMLEEKSEEEKIITLPSDAQGKIIAVNQEKIVAKIKTLIGTSNLKAVKIKVAMNQDENILATKQEIIITISKGKYSKTIASTKAYFVRREQNTQEITADINSVKTALTNLTSEAKALKLFIEKTDKSINANKDAILETLKKVEGYLEIDFKKVKIKVKNDFRNLPSSNQSPINIIFILSKGSVTPVEINVFTIKQLDSQEVQRIKNKLNEIKLNLEGLSSKIVNVDAPSLDKTITHNKVAIKSAVENLSGYGAIEFNGATLEIKDSSNNLPSNDQPAVAITLVLWKNSVNLEVEGFSAKQMLFSTTINNEIIAIKKILDGKSGQDLIIMLPSNSEGNIIGNAVNKNAIERKIRTLIDPLNSNGQRDHSSLKGTAIEVSMTNDLPISTTLQDVIVSITKSGGRTLRTIKTFQVKRAFTNGELANKDIESIKNVLDAKTGEDLIITLPSSSTGNIIENATNKNAIEKKLRILVDPSNTSGEDNHSSLKGTTIEISMNADAPISTTAQDVIVSISKANGTTLITTKTFQVKRAFTADEDIAAIKAILDVKDNNDSMDLWITLPRNSSGSIINKPNNKNAVERKIRQVIDPSNRSGDPNHPSLRGTTITLVRVISSRGDSIHRIYAKKIVITISKSGGTSLSFGGFVVRKS